MKTQVPRSSDITRDWYLVDAENMVLGRIATQIASVLRGKNKPLYAPSVDTGDFVIVVNAEKIALTGNKLSDKIYYSHSGYPGGIKSISAGKLLDKKSGRYYQESGQGDASKEQAGEPDAQEAQDLHRLKPPPQGPASQGFGVLTHSFITNSHQEINIWQQLASTVPEKGSRP
jgi:large subunit ribosomal protein L13